MEASGGADNLPADLKSIRPNFIERLKAGLDIDKTDGGSQ